MLDPVRLEVDPLTEDGSPAWLIDEALVKRHCRIDFTDDDDLLQVCLRASIEWAEGAAHRTIIRRGHRWVLREFPCDVYQRIWLPRGKTVSVDLISYVYGGAILTLSGPTSSPPGTDWQEDLRGDDGAIIMPPRGSVWPATDRDTPKPVTVEFTAGWPAADIPADLVNAILLGTSDMYDMRGSNDYAAASLVDAGKSLAVRNALVSPFALPRVYLSDAAR